MRSVFFITVPFQMAEKFRLQRVRSFYPLAGTGPFISNQSDISSGNSRRPYTGGFQVSSAKTHERTGSHLSKRMSTAVDFSRPCRNRESRATTLEIGQLEATGDKSSNEAANASVAEDGENPFVAEPEIPRPKRTITVILPSLKMTDEEEDIVAMDSNKSRALLIDASRDSLMRNGASTQQNLINGQSRDDQRSGAESSNDRAQLDQWDRKKSAAPVYKIKYVHFDKNRAAVGHARQVANRLYAINVGSEAINRFTSY